jgi:hypothetical protein
MEATVMTEAVLRIDADDVWHTLETLDPVAVLAEDLIRGAINHSVRVSGPACRLAPGTGDDGDYLWVDNVTPGLSCAMPAKALRMAHAAALAALATRELLPPGGITVAMLGTRYAIQSQLAVIARHVPDIVHVAVRVTDGNETDTLDPRLLDQLDLAGIGLSMATGLSDSLFGANLVVVVSEDALTDGVEQVGVKHLAHGTVLVNASGYDLPTELVDHADQIYVDDLALLPAHPDRYVVARHLSHAISGAPWTGGHDRPPTISSDLGLLLAGARPSHAQHADTLVVELLSVNAPNTHLAQMIARTAVRVGLGVRVTA